jgi:hypothetical protein
MHNIVNTLKSKIFKSAFFYHDISPYLSVMQFGGNILAGMRKGGEKKIDTIMHPIPK